MPSATLNPNAAGTYSAWGGSYSDVVANDGDSTYAFAGEFNSVGDRISFGYEDLPTYAIGVDSVAVQQVSRKTGGGAYCQSAAFTYNGLLASVGSPSTVDATYTAYNQAFASDGGGAAWTVANVGSAEFGLELQNVAPSPGEELRCTWLPVVVVYAVQPGGLSEIMGPFCAVLAAEIPRLCGWLARQSRGLACIRPDEYTRAWRELREARWPRHFPAPAAGWR